VEQENKNTEQKQEQSGREENRMTEDKKAENKTAEALLGEKLAEEGVSFAPGAVDGIYIYHTMHKEGPAEKLLEVIRVLHEKDEDEAEKLLHEIFMRPREVRMISMIDPLQHYIIDHADSLSPEKILKLASMAISSSNTEIVKFGLSLMEIVNFSESDDFRSVVVSLATDEEYTLFGIYVIRAWNDGDHLIFGLARRLTGWGRIHAIHYLKAETPEMKYWVLMEGWKNEIMPCYSALDAARKGNLTAFLEKDALESDEAENIEALVAALLDEGPVPGFSAYEEKDKLVNLLEKHRAAGAFTVKMDEMLKFMKGNAQE